MDPSATFIHLAFTAHELHVQRSMKRHIMSDPIHCIWKTSYHINLKK